MRNYEDQEEQQPPPRLDFSKRPGVSKKAELRLDRTMRLRLLSLFGLLILVIVAMKEAGKPERWMWLGFDDAKPDVVVSQDDISSGDISINSPATVDNTLSRGDRAGGPNGNLGRLPNRVASLLPQTDEGSNFDNENSDNENSDEADSEDEADTDNGGDFDSVDIPNSQLTPLALDFWESTFIGLSDDRKEAFYELLRRVDTSQLKKPTVDLPFDAVLQELTKEHGLHQSKMLGELAVMSKGQAKADLTKQLFAFDQSWQSEVLPTLKASVEGEDFTIADQSLVRSIRTIIDPIVLRKVQDRTGMGNPRDKLAWFAVWDQVQKDALTSPTEIPTTLLQLNGQPNAYRGKPLVVSGIAKTIRYKMLKDSLLNIKGYYELWIDPIAAASDDLICVYAANLPKQFEAKLAEMKVAASQSEQVEQSDQAADEPSGVTERFQPIDIPVTISGRFFKLRSYQDSSRAVSHCPVLLADTFTAEFPNTATGTGQGWQPSWEMVMIFLACAMAAAIGIAWAVYRSTKAGSSLPDKPVSGRVSNSLDKLSKSDAILTDAERVSQLNKVLDEDYS